MNACQVATALIPALAVSGLPSEKFVFEGFLPQKKGRQKQILALKDESRTIVFYESPYRLIKTLTSIIRVFGKKTGIVVFVVSCQSSLKKCIWEL